MALFTDIDATDATMEGDPVTSPGAAFLNKKRKAKFDPTTNYGNADINMLPAGAGADGTSNGTSLSNTTPQAKSVKPVVQSQADEAPFTATPVDSGRTQGQDVNDLAISQANEGQRPDRVVQKADGSEMTTGNQPILAKQGSGNPIIHAIQKKLGYVADSPEPGEMYKGPATDVEKSKHAASIATFLRGIGLVGNSIAAAGGSVPQQHEAMQIAEEQPKLDLQRLSMQNEMQHRLEMERQGQERVDVSSRRADQGDERVDQGQQGIDVRQQNADNQSTKTDALLEQKGLVKQKDGSVRAKTADEYAQDPRLQNNLEAQQAAKELKMLEQEKVRAQTAALTDPNSLPARQKAAQIAAMLQAAQTKMAGYVMARQVQATDSSTGQETITNMGEVNANPGKFIPLPTGTTRTMQQMAASVQTAVPQLIAQVQQLKAKLGPAVGRWGDLWVNRLGMDDQDFAGLDQNLHLYASAISRTHFGGSAPLHYTQALEKNFSEAQTPDDLLARIASAETWIDGYAKMSGRSGGGGKPSTPAVPKPTSVVPPAANSPKPPKPLADAANSTKPKPKW